MVEGVLGELDEAGDFIFHIFLYNNEQGAGSLNNGHVGKCSVFVKAGKTVFLYDD